MRRDDSSTMALQLLNWKPLKLRRQFHRCQFVYKSIEDNSVDFKFDNCCCSEVHSYNTRNKSQLRLPNINTHWGQLTTNYHFIKDWNYLATCICNES